MGGTQSTPSAVECHHGAFVPDVQRRRHSGLRMLCLHGHGSNNDITMLQVHNLLLRETHGISCDLFEAELETSANVPALEMFSDRPFRTWFRWYMPTAGPLATSTLDDSLERIMAVVREQGPYDGIYGFSQGAFTATTFCNPTVWRGRFGLDTCPFRFCILANAGLSDSLTTCSVAQAPQQHEKKPLRAMLAFPMNLPSVHLVGAKDWYKSSQTRNATLYERAVTYEHAYGHEIPLNLQHDHNLVSTLTRFLGAFTDDRF